MKIAELQELGIVTEEEKDQIFRIYSRKTALTDLMASLTDRNVSDASELYQRLVSDMAAATEAMLHWWGTVSRKYGWSLPDGAVWHINFETRLVAFTTNRIG